MSGVKSQQHLKRKEVFLDEWNILCLYYVYIILTMPKILEIKFIILKKSAADGKH